MTRRRQDFEINAGDAVVLNIAVVDDEGEAVNWSGKSVRWGFSDSAHGTAMGEKSSSGGGIVLLPGGIAAVTLDSADTADLSGHFYHEAEVSEGGRPVTTTVGDMVIYPSILD